MMLEKVSDPVASYGELPSHMIWLYRFFFLPVLTIASPYYLFRMWRRGGYGDGFFHRFGFVGPVPEKRKGIRRIWIQAVSVGELLSLGSLLGKLAEDPRIEIVLTTTTSTGLRLARDRYGDSTAYIGIFPLDFWLFSRLAWSRIDPDLAILTEGELWPEHINQAKSRNVRTILINARLSDRAYQRYWMFPWAIRSTVSSLGSILTSSDIDYERFLQLGAVPSKLRMAGNLKCDISIEPRLNDSEKLELRHEFGFQRQSNEGCEPLILLGSSTWPGEEATLIQVLHSILAENIPCRLLIVPRHAERRNEIESLLNESAYPYHFRSRGNQAPIPTMIYVSDTTGELKLLTQIADIAFIGKSLQPHSEGQTPIEAAILGKPILFGPGMSSFLTISEALLDCGAAQMVTNEADLREKLIKLLKSPEERDSMSIAAADWHSTNKDATEKTLHTIERILFS